MQRYGCRSGALLFAALIAVGSSVAASRAPAAEATATPTPQGVTGTVPNTASKADRESRREQLFQQMLDDPDNLDVAFEYAALSADDGDLEAAVATLERMLIFAPGLPRIQLELGVLYYRLAAYPTARAYFDAALSAPDVPDEVREKVEVYLRAMEQAEQPNRFAGGVLTGIRYQTNANAGVDARNVLLNGLPFLLDGDSTKKEDFNAFLAGSFHYSLDLHNQGDRLLFDVLTYNAWYFDRTDLDTNLAEVVAGPSFNMARFNLDNTYLDLYGLANGVLIDEDVHFATLGGGARITTRPFDRTAFTGQAEYRYRDFENSRERPTNDDRTGDEIRGIAGVTHVLSANVVIQAALRVTREDADAAYFDNWEYGGHGGATIFLPDLARDPVNPVAVNLNAGYLTRDYDDPDPIINARESQEDDEYWVNASVIIPILDWLSLVPQAEYRKVDSNYPTREYENFSVALALFGRL